MKMGSVVKIRCDVAAKVGWTDISNVKKRCYEGQTWDVQGSNLRKTQVHLKQGVWTGKALEGFTAQRELYATELTGIVLHEVRLQLGLTEELRSDIHMVLVSYKWQRSQRSVLKPRKLGNEWQVSSPRREADKVKSTRLGPCQHHWSWSGTSSGCWSLDRSISAPASRGCCWPCWLPSLLGSALSLPWPHPSLF